MVQNKWLVGRFPQTCRTYVAGMPESDLPMNRTLRPAAAGDEPASKRVRGSPGPAMSLTGWLRTAALAVSPASLRGAPKNIVLWAKALARPEAREIIGGLFSTTYYLDHYDDVRRSQVHPLLHYMVCGFLEGRRPSPHLDNNYYRAQYEDVARAGINPLLHYALFGKAEGRSLLPVRTKVLDIDAPDDAPLGPAARCTRIDNAWPQGRPLVSVIIPCFNYGRYIEEALESVLAQTFQDFEIIVVEGGSDDGITPETVSRIAARNHSKIQVFYRAERHLVGDNRNFGISRARGRYICCLDSDDILKPLYLEMAVFLAEGFGYDLVTPSLECFGDFDLECVLEDPSFPAIGTHNQVATTALFRRSAWEQIGGFRDWGLGREHVPEDWDFWVRMLGHGYRAKSIREALMLYRVHGSGLTATCETDRERQRQAIHSANRELFANPVPTPRELVLQVANRWTNLVPVTDGNQIPAILIALPFITVGGAEQLFQHICEGLAAKGFRIVIITTVPLPPSIKEVPDRYAGITSQVYHLPRLLDPEIWPQFVEYLIRRHRVESIVLAGSEFLYEQLPWIRERFPHLRIVDQQFNDCGHIRNNRHYSRLIDCTSVPSKTLAAVLIERHREDPSRVAVIPHGIDIRGPVWDRNEAFAASGLPDHARGKLLVAFCGRMSKEKSPETFVHIAARLARRESLFFIMTGEGPEWQAVKRLAARHRLDRSLYMPGFVKDQRPLMELADIVVLTSSLDGMPLVVLEAGALGKPVVASMVGSLPEMVIDGETGFLCPARDIQAFCNAIERLADSESLRRAFGERAREYVAGRFSSQAMVEAYLQVLAPRACSAPAPFAGTGTRRM